MLSADELRQLVPAAKQGNALAMEQELGNLPVQQAYVLEQYYCHNKSVENIARILHVAPRTVRYHRQMALEALRKCV